MEGSDQDPPVDERTEMLQALAISIGEYLQHSVPTLTEDQVIMLAVGVATEQLDEVDGKIMPSFEGELAEKYPSIVIGMRHCDRMDDPPVTVSAAKKTTVGTSARDALATAMVLSFLNSPHIRAGLRTQGHIYSFGQSAEPPPTTTKPKILLQ